MSAGLRQRASRSRPLTRALAVALAGSLSAHAATAAVRTVTFGMVSADAPYWAIFMARDKGFYERHGIALDLVPDLAPYVDFTLADKVTRH
jgi:ABC-type nitrate/sulfonate/bicarbonate transport system substrate-binding protein